MSSYRVNPAHRNWQIETAAWIWPSFFHCALETRWLGVRKTCGIGLFYRNYRPLLQETSWLGSDFISVCLETRWLGQKKWFLCPGTTLYMRWGNTHEGMQMVRRFAEKEMDESSGY